MGIVAKSVHFLLAESSVVVEVDLFETGLDRKSTMRNKQGTGTESSDIVRILATIGNGL